MSFSDNIIFLRKKANLTQEQLADKLEVSRQTVSKWEQGLSFPETDKILQICDMFNCDMDTIMRGNAEVKTGEDSVGYDRHMNLFSVKISLGVFFVFLGVAVMLFMMAFLKNEVFPVMVLFLFITAGVTLFIVAGMEYDAFGKKHPKIEGIYTQKQIERAEYKIRYMIAFPIAGILLSVALLIGASQFNALFGMSEESFSLLYVSIFLFLIAVCVSVMVFGGIQYSKYNYEDHNKEFSPNESQEKTNKKIGRWCSVIMLLCTAAFLVTGLVFKLWQYNWIIFAVGGLACGIASIILKKD